MPPPPENILEAFAQMGLRSARQRRLTARRRAPALSPCLLRSQRLPACYRKEESMLQIAIPGAEDLVLAHLICDLNGTLAVDGQVSEPLRARLRLLTAHLQVHLVSADTHGTLPQLVETLQQEGCSVQMKRVSTGEEKAAYTLALGPQQVVAVGNGVNDVAMFRLVRLSIAVCGAEGTARELLQLATLVVPAPEMALDLLLHPRRLTATLRP
jgi:soluble P-type ATPase